MTPKNLASFIGEAISDDVETYEVAEASPSDIGVIRLTIDSRTFVGQFVEVTDEDVEVDLVEAEALEERFG